MEENNKQQRSKLWEKIYEIINKMPRKEVDGDAADASSISSELEKLFVDILALHDNQSLRKQILDAFKEGFDSATASLIAANDAVQNRK